MKRIAKIFTDSNEEEEKEDRSILPKKEEFKGFGVQ